MTEAEILAGQQTQVLEIARWPEWGIERWEETNRTDEFSCPSHANQDEEEPGIAKWKENNQPEIAHPVPAGNGKDQPSNNTAKIAGGIVLSLLLLGGAIYAYEMSSANALVLQPGAMNPLPGISIELPAVAMPPVAIHTAVTLAQPLPVPPPHRRTATALGSKSRLSRASASGNPIKARATQPESRCDRAPVQRRDDGESQDLVRADWAEWNLCEEQQIRRNHPR